MEHSDRPGLPRTAVIVGHPLHPLLVVFRFGFLMGALATGFIFWGVTGSFLARVLVLLLSTGVAMGLLAAMARLIEFFAVSPVAATTFPKRCSTNNR
jgi:uncharacterized membrane protein